MHADMVIHTNEMSLVNQATCESQEFLQMRVH